jgi:hypothetical protein
MIWTPPVNLPGGGLGQGYTQFQLVVRAANFVSFKAFEMKIRYMTFPYELNGRFVRISEKYPSDIIL